MFTHAHGIGYKHANIHLRMHTALAKALSDGRTRIVESVRFDDGKFASAHLDKLNASRARIVVVLGRGSDLRMIATMAREHSMMTTGWAWISVRLLAPPTAMTDIVISLVCSNTDCNMPSDYTK